MNIKILTPELVVFEGDVKSVLLPGKNGEFQILNNHAAIVASLSGGKVKLFTDHIAEHFAGHFIKENDNVYSFNLRSGVIEFNNNSGIILAE